MERTIKKWSNKCFVICLLATLLIPDFTMKTALAADYSVVSVGDYLSPGDVFTNMVYVGDNAPACMFVFFREGNYYSGGKNATPIETATEGIYTYTLPDYGTACTAGFLPEIAAQSDKIFVCWKVTGAYVADGTALNHVVLMAVMADRYTISYEWDGAVPPAAYPTSYLKSERGVVVESLPVISKNGYTFEGWYTDDELAEENKITSVTEKQSGDLKLYPKFVPNNTATPTPAPSESVSSPAPSLAAPTSEPSEPTPAPESSKPTPTPSESVSSPAPPLAAPTSEPSEPTPAPESSKPTPAPSESVSSPIPSLPASTPEPSETTPAPEPSGPKPSETVPAYEKIYIDDTGKGRYKIRVNGNGTKRAIYIGPTNKKFKKVKIPGRAAFKGVRYKVVAMAGNAFKNCKRLRCVSIGKNVKKIGKKAFYGRKSLKKLKIRTKKLVAKKVGKKAFEKTYKKVTVTVPKKKLKAYKKLLRKKGISRKAKFKRIR